MEQRTRTKRSQTVEEIVNRLEACAEHEESEAREMPIPDYHAARAEAFREAAMSASISLDVTEQESKKHLLEKLAEAIASVEGWFVGSDIENPELPWVVKGPSANMTRLEVKARFAERDDADEWLRLAPARAAIDVLTS